MKAVFVSLLLLLVVAIPTSQARFVTLVINSSSRTSEFQIELNEVAELKGYSPVIPTTDPYKLFVTKDGIEIELFIPPSLGTSLRPSTLAPQHVVAGPARIRMVAVSPEAQAYYCTFNITPESFPPDRTMLVPAGTNNVLVKMECSTDLLHWNSATNGVYGNQDTAKFFRIKVDPKP